MSITLAKLLVLVGADTKEAEQGLGDVNKALKGTQSIGENALGVFSGVLMAKAVQGVASLAAEGLEAYASYERLGMSLNALSARELLVSGGATTMADAMEATKDQGQQLLATIEQIGIKSPFRQETIAATMQTAMGYGMASDLALEMTQSLVDLSAATGRGEKDLNMMGLALGQVWAKGKLTGEEMRQLTNAGLSVADVSRAMKIPIEDVAGAISDGAIKAKELIPALIDMINLDFGGEAERQSTSWAGLISTFEDLKEVNLREFFAGTLQELQPLAEELATALADPEFRAQVRETGQAVGDMVGQIVTSGRELIDFWQGIPGPVQTALLAFGGTMLVGPQVVGAFGSMMTGGVKLLQVMQQLQNGVGFFAVAQQGAIGLTGALLPVAAAVAAVSAAWVEWRKVQGQVDQGNQQVEASWSSFINEMVDSGASAAQVTEAVNAKMAETKQIMDEAGAAGVIVSRVFGGETAPSLDLVSSALQNTGASYEEYTAGMLDYLAAAGELTGVDQAAVEGMILTGDAAEDVAGQYGLMTREAYDAAAAQAKVNAAAEASRRTYTYQIASFESYMASMNQATITQQANTATGIEAEQVLRLVSDLYKELPANITDASDAQTILTDSSLYALDTTSQLKDEVTLATEAYAYGILGYERYSEVLVNATNGTLTFTDAQRQSVTAATDMAAAQAASAQAAGESAAAYWGLAESLKGASQAEIAKTMISDLTAALKETDDAATQNTINQAILDISDSFGITDEKSRALAASMPLLTQAMLTGIIPAQNADEALKYLNEDAKDGSVDFGKLIEKFGQIPGSLKPGQDAAMVMQDMWSNDVSEAFIKAQTEEEQFAASIQKLYDLAKNPINIKIVFTTSGSYTVPGNTTTTGGGGGGGGSSGTRTGGGNSSGNGTSAPDEQYGTNTTNVYNTQNYNYNEGAAATNAALADQARRENSNMGP
jgi:tape measure domain-containing protein